MKILITNTGPWGTGSFTVAKAITEEFLKLGHQVKLFFPDAKVPCSESDHYYNNPDTYEIWQFPLKHKDFSLDSFPLIIPDPHPRNAKGKTLLELSKKESDFYFQEFEKKITKVLEDFQPDIIECQHIWAFDQIIKKFNYPFICVAHHSDQLGFKYHKTIRPKVIESAKQAQFIFAISDYVKKEVVSLYNVPDDKVIVIKNGFDKEVFYPKKLNREKVLQDLQLSIPPDATIVSFAGKISLTKGIDLLLKANKLISKDKNIHFLVLGAGDIDDLLSEEEKKECCFKHMHFLGHRSAKTLAEIHNICDYSVLPSRSEGFGIACLESMACGLPVIATKIGGLEELAVGKIIPSESSQKLAEAVIEFSIMPKEELKKLSEKALSKAKEYSWKRIAKQRLNYYKKVLTSK